MTPEEARQQAQTLLGRRGTLTGLFFQRATGSLADLEDQVSPGDTLVATYTDANGGERSATLTLTRAGTLVPTQGGTVLPAPPREPEPTRPPRTLVETAEGRTVYDLTALEPGTVIPGTAPRPEKPEIPRPKGGTIEYANGVPIGQWSQGGTFLNYGDKEQAAAIQARYQELYSLVNNRWNTGEDREALTRQYGPEMAQLERAYTLIAPKAATGAGGGGSPRDPIAEINARAEADLRRELAVIEYKMNAGLLESADAERQARALAEAAAEQARHQHALALAQEQSSLRSQEAEAGFAREAPFKTAEANRAAAQLTMQRDQQRLTGARAAAEVYGQQAKAGQEMIRQGIEAGVAPPAAMIRFAYDPYVKALQLIAQGLRAGDVDPSWVPASLSRLQPAAQTGAPLAPGPQTGAPLAPGSPTGAPMAP